MEAFWEIEERLGWREEVYCRMGLEEVLVEVRALDFEEESEVDHEVVLLVVL